LIWENIWIAIGATKTIGLLVEKSSRLWMGIETIQTVDRFQWTFTGNPHLFAEKSLVPVKFKLVHWNKFHVSYLICVSTHQWYQIIRTYGFVRKYGTPNPMARHFPIKITLLGYTPRSDTPRYHRCWWRPIKSEIHSEKKKLFKKKMTSYQIPFQLPWSQMKMSQSSARLAENSWKVIVSAPDSSSSWGR
jgi:hypothetical protein